jgi:AcrR family transcriptional regulator
MFSDAMQDDPNSPAAEDVSADIAGDLPRVTRKRPKPGERRVQILQALAEMLQQPGAERITTAALAARLSVSEAALYRHFASKAQMFEGLIEFIEQTFFRWSTRLPNASSRRPMLLPAGATLPRSWRWSCNLPRRTRA